MEAKRASLALLAAACASLVGCAMLQPRSQSGVEKSGEAKRKDPPEVVVAPASQPATDEGSNAIVQWARNAMKAREGQPAQRTSGPPAAAQPPDTRAQPSGSGGPPAATFAGDAAPETFQATIPVRSTAAPTVQDTSARPPREVAVRREQSSGSVDQTADDKPSVSPPKLGPVSARPAARPPVSPQARRTGDTRIALNDPETAATTGENLRELLDEALAQPGDASFREQLDRKMLLVMRGEIEKAREPFVLASQAQQEMGRRLLESLIAIREGHGGDPGGEAAGVLTQVNQLRESLVKVSDLSLPTFAICRAVRGFGQYEPIDPPRFIAGRENEFVAYCEIRDFVSEQRDDAFVSNFAMKIAILDRSDDEVHSISADDILDRCRARRIDCFLSPLVRLPATLGAGEYVARITIHDKIGKKVAEKLAKFRLVAKG